jgi:peroxiredoxin
MKTFFVSLLTLLLITSTAFGLSNGEEDAPAFELLGADGKVVKSSDFKGKIVVLEWTNPGCPYVKKHYGSGHMQKLQGEVTKKGVVWLTINSTNSEHGDFIPADERETFVKTQKMNSTAYLTDADGKVGQLYEAKTTPHLFVIDANGKIVYQGAIDDTPMGDPASSKNYVSQAVDELLAGKEVSEAQTKSYGCSVKY